MRITEHQRKIIERLNGLSMRMSYNDSYFGEPEGQLKRDIRELKHSLRPREILATDLKGNTLTPEPFCHGLIPYLWLKYVKKQDVHFIGWRG